MPPVNKTPRGASPHRQRGVAAIFAALSLITLLSAVGLAIDVGRLYYANRELQRLTDLAAIDGARVRSQCLGNAGIDEVTAEVDASLLRNRLPPLVTTVTRLGKRQVDANGLQFFQPVTAGQPADSVQVTLSRPSPARILPLFAGDDSRVLTTRAAAVSSWVAPADVGPPVNSSSGNVLPTFYGGALRANLALGGGGIISGTEASVTVSDLVVNSSDVTSQLPDIETPTPVLGLLSQLEATLNATGDVAGATLVDAYAAAIAVGRPGATVVPAEVLGLPLQGPYDGATASVGSILGAIAGAVSEGDPIQLPSLCALLGIEGGAVPVVSNLLCDTTITASIPQGSRPGTSNSSTPILDVSDTSDDSARTASGLVRVGIKLVNPLTGQPLNLVLKAEAEGANAKVTSLSCARLGQGQNVASVTAKGPVVTFAIGDSAAFDQSFSTPNADLGGVLNDVAPVRLLTASVQDVLTNAGLGGLLLNNPLNLGFLGQPVTVSARLQPVTIGDGRAETFCMQGPPFKVTDQCNGAPALIGGVSGQAAAAQLASLIGDVELTVTLPNNLPPALDAVLREATDLLTQTLTTALQPALQLVAGQMVPILQSANLVVGESQVTLYEPKIIQPKIYAQ